MSFFGINRPRMEELLQRIQQYDDQQAFQQLYQLLFFRLYQFARTYVRSRESAEEVVNDVFLGLWRKRARLYLIANVQVYLYIMVKNTALNHLRKERTAAHVPLKEIAACHLQPAPNPESLFITRELQTRIREAIAQLPPRCGMIFKLIREDGLSYKEVGEILHISVKTVDTQLYRALKKLSDTLLPLKIAQPAGKKLSPG